MDKKMKQNMWLIAFGVILYVALMNFSSVLIFFEKIVSITLPLLVGFALAFMLSVPMKGFEKLLKKELQGSQAYKQAVESWMDSQKGGKFESAADSLAQALAKSE